MITEIKELPDPPSRNDPSTFSTKADATLGALPEFVTDFNANVPDLNALGKAAPIAIAAANYQGEYNAMTTYTVGQSVSYLGSQFSAKKTNLGITPVDGADWLEIVALQRIPTGSVQQYIGVSSPTGWLLLDGGTIGNDSSGATVRANSDTQDLFVLLWDSMANAQAPVSSGRGASALADFSANKTITLPDARGRAAIGAGSGVSLTARTLGATGGSETHFLSISEMPNHSHTYTRANPTGAQPTGTSQAGTQTANTSSEGGGVAHNNMQPWLALTYIIKL